MNRLLPLIAACVFIPVCLAAQCPVVLNCPDQTDTLCDITGNDPLLWNEPYWFDPVHQIKDLSDAPVDLSIRVIDTCGGTLNISCYLWLDLDGDEVLETRLWPDSVQVPGAIHFNNLKIAGGEVHAFDQRPVPDDEKYRFALEKTTSGDTAIARLRWNTTANPDAFFEPQLPAGLYRIRWIVGTPQGVEKWCTYTFYVRDCAPPVPICLNGISGNIPPVKFLRIWDTDLLLDMQDNQTPSGQLQTAVRKSGTGTGFPVHSDGTPVHYVTFNCEEMGPHNVEIWAMDQAGNAIFCETMVTVTDNSGNCSDPGTLSVCVTRYCDGSGMEEVVVMLKGNHPALPPLSLFTLTANNGCVTFQSSAIPWLGNYAVSPQKNDFPSTTPADIERVRRHLDGMDPFTDPYQWVAADVNNDNAVDSSDLVEMEQVAAGQLTQWTNNTPWRFVPKSYVFPTPDPLSAPVPFAISLDLPGDNLDFDFVGVRTGDLDLCASSRVNTVPVIHMVGPAQPNPTAAGVLIAFHLGHAAEVRLDVFDFQGRRVYGRTLHLPAGSGQIEVPEEAFPASGVYGWRVTAEGIGVGGKVVRL